MDLLAEKQKLVGRTFRHFKGNLYRLEGFAKDSETLEEMAVYRALYGECGLWVRPAAQDFLKTHGCIEVVFCCFSSGDRMIYEKLLKRQTK